MLNFNCYAIKLILHNVSKLNVKKIVYKCQINNLIFCGNTSKVASRSTKNV